MRDAILTALVKFLAFWSRLVWFFIPKFIKTPIRKRFVAPLKKRAAELTLRKNGYCPVHHTKMDRDYIYGHVCYACRRDKEEQRLVDRDKEVKAAIKILSEK